MNPRDHKKLHLMEEKAILETYDSIMRMREWEKKFNNGWQYRLLSLFGKIMVPFAFIGFGLFLCEPIIKLFAPHGDIWILLLRPVEAGAFGIGMAALMRSERDDKQSFIGLEWLKIKNTAFEKEIIQKAEAILERDVKTKN